MSEAKPAIAESPKPNSSNSAAPVIIVVVILAVLLIPVVLGGLLVAGGAFVFWASEASPATNQERIESISAPAIEMNMRSPSRAPAISESAEAEPVQP